MDFYLVHGQSLQETWPRKEIYQSSLWAACMMAPLNPKPVKTHLTPGFSTSPSPNIDLCQPRPLEYGLCTCKCLDSKPRRFSGADKPPKLSIPETLDFNPTALTKPKPSKPYNPKPKPQTLKPL